MRRPPSLLDDTAPLRPSGGSKGSGSGGTGSSGSGGSKGSGSGGTGGGTQLTAAAAALPTFSYDTQDDALSVEDVMALMNQDVDDPSNQQQGWEDDGMDDLLL